MELAVLFCSAFVVGFSGAIMPGPVLTATISEVMKHGFRAGPMIVLGHAILEICLILAVVAGLGRWLQLPAVVTGLGLVGGALLCGLGLQMIFTSRSAARQALEESGNEEMAVRGPVIVGMLTSLANPYWTLWWATIGMHFLTQALRMGLPGLGSFFVGHISADLTWFSLVAAAVASGRKFCSRAAYRRLIVLCGIALIGLGSYFIVQACRSAVSVS